MASCALLARLAFPVPATGCAVSAAGNASDSMAMDARFGGG
jgi:hypothetical protein